ncbi:MAG: hypothetical protein ACK5UQ_18240 [Planctomycetota bacterium]
MARGRCRCPAGAGGQLGIAAALGDGGDQRPVGGRGRWRELVEQRRVRPAALREHEAQRAFAAQFGEDALSAAWLLVGTVDVLPGNGAAAPTAIRLPESWATWRR